MVSAPPLLVAFVIHRHLASIAPHASTGSRASISTIPLQSQLEEEVTFFDSIEDITVLKKAAKSLLRQKDAMLKAKDEAAKSLLEAKDEAAKLLLEKDARLREKDATLRERLLEKDAMLKAKDEAAKLLLEAKDEAAKSLLREKDARLREKDATLKAKDETLEEKERMISTKQMELLQAKGTLTCRGIMEYGAERIWVENGMKKRLIITQALGLIDKSSERHWTRQFYMAYKQCREELQLPDDCAASDFFVELYRELSKDIHGAPWSGQSVKNTLNKNYNPLQYCVMTRIVTDVLGWEIE